MKALKSWVKAALLRRGILVSRPPGVPGDQPTWTASSVGPYPCRACGGTGLLVTKVRDDQA